MKKIIYLFAFIFSLNISFSQNNTFKKVENLNSLKQKITEFTKKTNSIKSNFTQEKHLEILEEPLISKGSFLYKKENKIRWEYFEPIKYIITIYNGEFTIKDETKISKYDIESNKMFKEINNMIITSIKGEIINNKEFTTSFFENSNYYLARLIPNKKEMLDFIKTIKIYFSKKDFSVSKIIMKETEKDYTKILFNNKKINLQINDNLFLIK